MRRGTGIVRAALVCLILAGVMVWPATGAAAGSAYYVGTLADDDGTQTANCAIPTNTDCSLRAAIAAASSGSDWIMFRAGLSGTITLTHGQLSILNTLAIFGPGADVLTVSGNHASRVFYVDMPDPVVLPADDKAVEIRGLTIADGLAGAGGGVYFAPGFYHSAAFALTIRDCTFSGNKAIDQGGGLYVSNAYWREDRQYRPVLVNVLNSTFVNNDADGRGGGAIQNGSDGTDGPYYIVYDNQNTTQLTITNSTIVGNSAGWNGTGGAIRNWSRLAVINSTLTQNSSDGSVGGIHSIIGSTSVTNTIVSGNVNGDASGNLQGDNNLIGSLWGGWPMPGTNNLFGVSAVLGTLGYYGGTTQTVPLVPGSPAIDAGKSGIGVPTTDQRGISRLDHPMDIGAYEARGFTIANVSGDQQSTTASTNFPEPFVVSVTSPYGDPVVGGAVTFTGPVTGASIQGSPVQGVIGADGQTLQTLTANKAVGVYTVQASIAGAGPITYSLENTDTTPPFTLARAKKADDTEYNFGSGANQPVTIMLVPFDNQTEVAQTTYSIDGGDPQSYQAPVTISSDGVYTFTYWSTDTAGNVEASHTGTISIDSRIVDPPDTTLLDHPPAVTSNSQSTFVFSSISGSNPGGGFQCKLDAGGWWVFDDCTSPFFVDLEDEPDGPHTFLVRAVDPAGNVDPTPATYTWTLERTLPETTLLTTPPAESNSSSATFTFTGSDISGIAGFNCRLDYAFMPDCTSPLELTGLRDGSHTLQVWAVDTLGSAEQDWETFTWTVSGGMGITSAASTAFIVGTAGSFTVTTSGSPVPTLSLTGSLPAGVSFDSASGVLSGTPAAGSGGVYPLTITASNGEEADVTQAFTLTVNAAPAFTSLDAVTFLVGVAGSFSVTADGFPSASFSVTSGELPAGVSLASDGLLSGTAAAGTGGVYPVTITATNGVEPVAAQAFTLTVNDAPLFTSPATTTFVVGQPGSFTVTADGSTAPSYSVTSGNLPAGVSLSSDGVLSGTPAVGTGGVYPLTISAANGEAADATQSFTLTVNEAAFITSEDATTFTVGVAGSFQVTATGFPVASFSVAGGNLPADISLSSDGLLSGTPESGSGGVYSLIVMASNGVGHSPLQLVTVTISEAPTFTSAETAIFITGQPGGFTVTANGYPQATFSSEGTFPAGVTLTSGGILSGTPSETAAGSYPITITATNGLMPDATQSFTLNVYEPLKFTSLDTTTFSVGVEGNFLVTASGMPIMAFSTNGPLPAGVSFSSNGVLSGTPEAGTGGVHTFEIVASNGIQPDATQMFTLRVNEASAFTSDAATTFEVGQAGSFTVTASGDPAATFSLEGTLPNGVTFSSEGLLSGTPVDGSGGVYQVSLVATNGVEPDATQTFTLTVNEAPVITSVDTATFDLNILGSVSVTADGYPQASFSTSGPLPGGVTLGADGLLSGAATESGTFAFTIVAGNGVGPDASQLFTLTVVVPTILQPENLSAPNDTGFAGAIVSYPAPQTIGRVGDVTCTPVSGSFFALGTTTVECVSSLTPATAAFTITVVDTVPPTIVAPANIELLPTGPDGADVTYPAPLVTDNAPGVTVVCSPPSGSRFSIGVTTVTCTATDSSGNTASATFTVTVLSGAALLGQLETTIDDVSIGGTPATAASVRRNLLAMVETAQMLEAANQTGLTCLQLTRIDLEVRAQVSKRRITPADAAVLYAQTTTIRAAIGCGTP